MNPLAPEWPFATRSSELASTIRMVVMVAPRFGRDVSGENRGRKPVSGGVLHCGSGVGERKAQQLVQLPPDPAMRDEMTTGMNVERDAAPRAIGPLDPAEG